MLQNPYYKGDVVYGGVRYDGAHEPLVAPEVWYQVQSVFKAHNSSGDRTQKHDHYLKGTVHCRECGSRLMISKAKARNGTIYPYFVFLGRHQKRNDCTQAAILVGDVEDLIVDYYERIQLSSVTNDALRGRCTTNSIDSPRRPLPKRPTSPNVVPRSLTNKTGSSRPVLRTRCHWRSSQSFKTSSVLNSTP